MPRKSRKLAVGDRAPSFKLEDAASGGQVALEDLLGKPLMIVFLRGTW
jgi:peroxiredoxin